MAADVQDVEPDLAVAEWDNVQAIAGQFVAGPVDPREVRARDARCLAGQNVSWIFAAALRSRDIRSLAFVSRTLVSSNSICRRRSFR